MNLFKNLLIAVFSFIFTLILLFTTFVLSLVNRIAAVYLTIALIIVIFFIFGKFIEYLINKKMIK